HGLAVTPDGKRLVAGSNQEVLPGQGATPPKPEGMSEAEHQRHHAPPPAGASQAGVSHVAVVSAQDGKVLRRIDVKGAVHHTLVTPDGRYAISTHTTAGGISVIDLLDLKVVKTLPTGPIPNYAVATQDGQRVYVSNAGNNTISEIDTGLWIVTRNILAGVGPEHVVLSPDEKTLYVNNVGNATVSAIDLNTGKVMKTYNVGEQPHGIDISDDGKTLFVASKQDNQVAAINLGDDKQRTIALQPAPYHVTAIHGTGKLYVSSRKEPKIWVLDQRTLEIRGEIPVRGEGHQMVVVNP
ncbi:MAG: beta-propeller fold lactonase family protein, partial [Gammaproteobacteria bacterium]|nr:beta-propeller fold lactonase family protein [Gammaproteobacteria bacterium]